MVASLSFNGCGRVRTVEASLVVPTVIVLAVLQIPCLRREWVKMCATRRRGPPRVGTVSFRGKLTCGLTSGGESQRVSGGRRGLALIYFLLA